MGEATGIAAERKRLFAILLFTILFSYAKMIITYFTFDLIHLSYHIAIMLFNACLFGIFGILLFWRDNERTVRTKFQHRGTRLLQM